MNILYHFRTRGTGGEGVHISGIITALRKLGYRVDTLSPSGVDPVQTKGESPYGQKKKVDFFSWISLHMPYVFFEALEILYNIADYFLLHRTLRGKRVDMIYERYAFFLFAGVLTARRRNIPIIVEINEISGHERVRKQ
ncbi:MAG: glycosyltransferase, partial [Nitrospinae bacterium]|nr:glycosyltransferase [Nitrospinota bacterium]